MTDDSLNSSHFESHITITIAGLTALDQLAANTPLSRQKLKKAMTNGAVWLESSIGTQRLRRAKKVLSVNDRLHLYYDESIQNTKPEDAILIADEGEYSIWNKPYGMYSQGTKWGDQCTLHRYAEQFLQPQRPAFPVHRLDRAATGLMILAHSKTMAATFSTLFKNRSIQKRYTAVVEGALDNLILPYSISSDLDNKPAISKIIALQKQGNNTIVSIEIETGRKHQIRKHLSELGYPIVGDRLYGSGKSEENLQLQSNYLNFNCPIKNTTQEYSLD